MDQLFNKFKTNKITNMSTLTNIEINPQSFVESNKIEWQQMAEGVKRKILSYDENLMMVRVDFEKGAIGAIHQHRHIQISNIESGSFEVEIGGVKKVLNAGDVFYVHSNVLHGVVCLEKGVLIDVFNPMREDFFQ
jgi:quercetin dioxygenase-like cupin family protein